MGNEDAQPLRFVDGPTTATEIDIAAPPQRVWEVIVDPGMSAQFSEEFQGGHWDDPDGEIGVGSTFTGHNQHPRIGEWSTTSHIIEYDPPSAIAWAVSDPVNSAARWTYRLSETDGGTHLHYTVLLGPGPSGLTPVLEAMPDKESQILHNRLAEHRRNMERVLEGVKQIVESAD